MNLAICSLASGSSGNCYVVYSDSACILVDAGISGKQITTGLEILGKNKPDAILVTHEHSDHVKGLKIIANKKDSTVYANEKTLQAIEGCEKLPKSTCFATGDEFYIGDILVKSFPVSHDASDPTGYSFCRNGKRISIISDTGYVTEESFGLMKDSGIIVLESNHDEAMLRIGRYPWFLKQRILSDKGHLSNEAAAKAILRLVKQDVMEVGSAKERTILLAHLSKENNFPQMALATVNNVLECEGFNVGKNLNISCLSRTEMSCVYEI